MRDIAAPEGDCTTELDGVSAIGATLQMAGDHAGCWQHVHPHTLDVRDFSYWSANHPGNRVAERYGRRNPITRWAELGSASLAFPYHHLISQWSGKQALFPLLGRLGDSVDFAALTASVQTSAMATLLGAAGDSVAGGVEACGSPGEVANDPALGHYFKMYMTEYARGEPEVHRDYVNGMAKKSTWLDIATSGADQLRQRVAWSLMQIIVIGEGGIGDYTISEPYLTYYDILVRHALGDFHYLLREVAFSPVMARYLTFLGSRGYVAAGTYPDENFAREVMQLFSIGLWKLNMDGTQQHDGAGQPIPTYDNDDIMDFSRAWTGFDLQAPRGNLEHYFGDTSENMVDPMQLKPTWRDAFPKMDLHDRYLGDGHPLCAELPPRSFLRVGARYRYLGYNPVRATSADSGSSLEYQQGLYPWTPGHLALDPASALWPKLCAPDGNGGCTFVSEVTLEQNLPCHGVECGLETISLLNVTVGGNTGYYEYVRVSCVELAFFEGGRLAATGRGAGSRSVFCLNPHEAAAGAACCPPKGNAQGECAFFGETMTFDQAETRCAARAAPGDYWGVCPLDHAWSTVEGCGYDYGLSWEADPCELMVQVHPTGHVSLVHIPAADANFAVDSPHLFRVRWHEGSFPTTVEGCVVGCEARADTCLCNTSLSRVAVYFEGGVLPSAAEIDLRLGLGAPNPASFDGGAYARCESAACLATDAEVWVAEADGGGLGPGTIFTVVRNGTFVVHLANAEATVHVAGHSFRNPPHFVSFAGANAASRDVAYETEAVLRHFSSHQNVPPFLARRLIQRLVTSNPSPRYISAVAHAFATGSYSASGASFGDGAYGDLGAAVAAILLDREARSVELDADPTRGRMVKCSAQATLRFRAKPLPGAGRSSQPPPKPPIPLPLHLQARSAAGAAAQAGARAAGARVPAQSPARLQWAAACIPLPARQRVDRPAALLLTHSLQLLPTRVPATWPGLGGGARLA